MNQGEQLNSNNPSERVGYNFISHSDNFVQVYTIFKNPNINHLVLCRMIFVLNINLILQEKKNVIKFLIILKKDLHWWNF